jgi:hypothetical protein
MPDDVIYLRLAFLRALTWPRLDLGLSISNARSRYQAAIFKYLALRFASVAVVGSYPCSLHLIVPTLEMMMSAVIGFTNIASSTA